MYSITLNRMFEDDFTTMSAPTYPILQYRKKGDNKYDIEIALAGYSKDDVEVRPREWCIINQIKRD